MGDEDCECPMFLQLNKQGQVCLDIDVNGNRDRGYNLPAYQVGAEEVPITGEARGINTNAYGIVLDYCCTTV